MSRLGELSTEKIKNDNEYSLVDMDWDLRGYWGNIIPVYRFCLLLKR